MSSLGTISWSKNSIVEPTISNPTVVEVPRTCSWLACVEPRVHGSNYRVWGICPLYLEKPEVGLHEAAEWANYQVSVFRSHWVSTRTWSREGTRRNEEEGCLRFTWNHTKNVQGAGDTHKRFSSRGDSLVNKSTRHNSMRIWVSILNTHVNAECIAHTCNPSTPKKRWESVTGEFQKFMGQLSWHKQ